MIAFLDGVIEAYFDQYIIVNVNGVGYKVLVSNKILSEFSTIHSKIKLYIHTAAKENSVELFGFRSVPDLLLFEKLISVSGIGPKIAMGAFNYGEADDIKRAILDSNVGFFTSVPRFGKKNAQKVIIELKNKIGGENDVDMNFIQDSSHDSLIEALKNFGFTRQEALSAIKAVQGGGETLEEKLKLALKYLGK